jgi:hypothetical protein
MLHIANEQRKAQGSQGPQGHQGHQGSQGPQGAHPFMNDMVQADSSSRAKYMRLSWKKKQSPNVDVTSPLSISRVHYTRSQLEWNILFDVRHPICGSVPLPSSRCQTSLKKGPRLLSIQKTASKETRAIQTDRLDPRQSLQRTTDLFISDRVGLGNAQMKNSCFEAVNGYKVCQQKCFDQ